MAVAHKATAAQNLLVRSIRIENCFIARDGIAVYVIDARIGNKFILEDALILVIFECPILRVHYIVPVQRVALPIGFLELEPRDRVLHTQNVLVEVDPEPPRVLVLISLVRPPSASAFFPGIRTLT